MGKLTQVHFETGIELETGAVFEEIRYEGSVQASEKINPKLCCMSLKGFGESLTLKVLVTTIDVLGHL